MGRIYEELSVAFGKKKRGTKVDVAPVIWCYLSLQDGDNETNVLCRSYKFRIAVPQCCVSKWASDESFCVVAPN